MIEIQAGVSATMDGLARIADFARTPPIKSKRIIAQRLVIIRMTSGKIIFNLNDYVMGRLFHPIIHPSVYCIKSESKESCDISSKPVGSH